MAAATRVTHWDEPLFPIFNKLANDGKKMNSEFFRKYPDILAKDKDFKPFESFTDLFGVESRKELSLIAFAVSGDDDINSDIYLCELLGRELDQCRGEDSRVKLTVNKNLFLKNEKDTDLNACNNLFDMIKKFRPELTSSQFLYILLGLQQKNFSMFLSALKSIAFDLALQANKDQIRRILKQERESLTGRIFANPSTINIDIFLPENVEHAFVYWNASIPIQIALDSRIGDVFLIENFIFYLDVTASDELYYNVHEKYLDFIINMFKYYYTFLIKNVRFMYFPPPAVTPMTTSLDTESYEKLLRETEEAKRKATRTPQEVAADEKKKELRLAAHLARGNFMGGKRQKKIRIRVSKKRFHSRKSRHKNKSRRRKN
jgi:hypothetical protein